MVRIVIRDSFDWVTGITVPRTVLCRRLFSRPELNAFNLDMLGDFTIKVQKPVLGAVST
jgi:hypothetical protein